jgi:hypothetical protein
MSPSEEQTSGEQSFPVQVQTDDKIAAFRAGKRVTASGAKTRSQWSLSNVLIVGLVLIGAATVAAIIRDAIYLEMVESKAKSQMRQMEETYRGF